MSVYFVVPVADRSRIKVGTSTQIEKRLPEIARDFPDGIELVAIADGDAATERAFHRLMEPYWIEGEWYAYTPEVQAIVAPFKNGVDGRRIWGRFRVVHEDGGPLDEDKRIAFEALKRLLDKSGAVPVAVAQQNAFEQLHAINPMWSRRRVRAIWERSIRRVDLYEIRDIETALDAYREQVGGFRGVDNRAGTEG